MKRLFIGMPVSKEVRRAAAALVPRIWRPNVNWVAPENYHVTLRFLGSTPDEEVPRWVSRIEAAAVRTPPFDVRFGNVVARKNVIWVAVEEGAAELAGLARAFDEDPAGYRPHLTLGRPKERVRLGHLPLDVRQRAERIVLYESRTLAAGPVYTELESFVLGLPEP